MTQTFNPIESGHPMFEAVDAISRLELTEGMADIEAGTLKVSSYTRWTLEGLARLVESFPSSLASPFAQWGADIVVKVRRGDRS